jgi:hypothetical protein
MHRRFIEMAPDLEVAHRDALTGQRTGNEEGLAADARNATTIVREGCDLV